MDGIFGTRNACAINGGGAIEVQVTTPASDSSLARIVEEAQERKGRSQRLADRIARPLVPGILVLAALIAGLGALLGDPQLWLERALVVLVAASPCALAIAVPLTVVAACSASELVAAVLTCGLGWRVGWGRIAGCVYASAVSDHGSGVRMAGAVGT